MCVRLNCVCYSAHPEVVHFTQAVSINNRLIHMLQNVTVLTLAYEVTSLAYRHTGIFWKVGQAKSRVDFSFF